LLQILGEFADPADTLQPDAVVEHFPEFSGEKPFEKPHERFNLILRSIPVLFRESIKREPGNADLTAGSHNGPHRFSALLMASDSVEGSLLGPSAIAVHDNGHMLRQFCRIQIIDHWSSVMGHWSSVIGCCPMFRIP
jgi:hypothetical protein